MIRTKYTAPSAALTARFDGQLSSAIEVDAYGRLAISGRPDVMPNGVSTFHLKAAATTNSNLIKTGAGKIVAGIITNTSAATKFVKFYNKATAPTVGTDTPVLVIPLPTLTKVDLAAVFADYGYCFPLGIGIGITGAVADNDTTALTANDVIANVLYV